MLPFEYNTILCAYLCVCVCVCVCFSGAMSMAMAMATTLISMHLLLLMMMIYTAAFHAAIVEADFRFSYDQADKTLPPNLTRRYKGVLEPDGTVWLTPPPTEQQPNQTIQKPGWLLYDDTYIGV